MKKIFIISQKLTGGGAERVASNLSYELTQNQYYKVYLVLFDGQNSTYPSGAEIIDMGLGPQSNAIGKISIFFRRVMKLRKLKKQYRPDVSISLLSAPNLINVLSKYGDKVIVSIRNFISRSANSTIEKYFVRYSSKKADITVCLSKLVELDMIDNFGAPEDRIVTIYNTVDADRLMKLSAEPEYRVPKQPYVVTMGRLMRQKGQWHLINAFKRVHEICPELRLVILGEGELEDGLKKLAKDCGIESTVEFMGFVKNPHRIIKGAEAFVFSSLFEGLGNVLLEALACKVPVVSTDCAAGPREILSLCETKADLNKVTNGVEFAEYGILTMPFNVDDEPFFKSQELTKAERYLAEAIIRIYSNKTIAANYRAKSTERIAFFSKEKIIAEWKKVIDCSTEDYLTD